MILISYLETAVALVFVFGILVMFHELGHFLVARATGMRVEEFAFGFGPKVLTLFKRNGTEYTIHPYPIGGFVKIAGMEPGEEGIPDGFQAQSIAKRAAVIFAGPFASLLLGMGVFIGLGLLWGYPGDHTTNKIAMVDAQTEAQRVGLMAGDRVTSINGSPITDGSQMTDVIHGNPGKPLNLTVVRSGQTTQITATPRWSIRYLQADWQFMDPKAGTAKRVPEGSVAQKAGVRKDDKLVSINGKAITDGAAMVQAIDAAGANKVTLTVERGKQIKTLEAVPPVAWVSFAGAKWYFPGGWADVQPGNAGLVQDGDVLVSINGTSITSSQQVVDAAQAAKPGAAFDVVVDRQGKTTALQIPAAANEGTKTAYYESMGLLGFVPETLLEKATVSESLKTGVMVPVRIVQSFGHMTRDDIGGPLVIAKITYSSTARGIYWILWQLGALSMSLAFINLIPIPLVDGGHLALLGIEAVRRKRLTESQMAMVGRIGMLILMTLFILIFWSDLGKIIGGRLPQ